MSSEDMWISTMNPDTRTIIQVKIEDLTNTSDFFANFVSDKTKYVKKRKEYIINMAQQYNFDDIIEG